MELACKIPTQKQLLQFHVFWDVCLCCWAGSFWCFTGFSVLFLEGQADQEEMHGKLTQKNCHIWEDFILQQPSCEKLEPCSCRVNVSHGEPCLNCVTFLLSELCCTVFHQMLFDGQLLLRFYRNKSRIPLIQKLMLWKVYYFGSWVSSPKCSQGIWRASLHNPL